MVYRNALLTYNREWVHDKFDNDSMELPSILIDLRS